MSDEPTTIDWNLHMTRGHTPMKDWEKRNSVDHYYSADADEWLVRVAPMFREEVIRLREEQKQIRELLAEVLPRKDGSLHMGTVLWGLESELKSTTNKIAIILGMAEREEE